MILHVRTETPVDCGLLEHHLVRSYETKLLDGVILLCAVLLFAVMSLFMTTILPAWPVTILLAIGITAVFVWVCRFLFVVWIGATPGKRLARLAFPESGNAIREEEELEARFR
jgi:hypothetical protein